MKKLLVLLCCLFALGVTDSMAAGTSSSGNSMCPQRPPLLDAETGSVEKQVSCYTTYSWPRDLNTNIVTDHVKRGNYCDKKCIDSGWYYTLRSDACEDGYKPDDSKTMCIKKEDSSDNGTSGNPNCPQGPLLAETGSVEKQVSCYTTYSWPRDLNTNIVTNHVKRGSYCDKKCIDSGWYYTLRSDACEDGYKPDNSKTKCIKREGSSDNSNKNCVIRGGSDPLYANTGDVKDNFSCTPVVNYHPLTSSRDENKKPGDNCHAVCEDKGWNVTLMDDACKDGYKPDTNYKKSCKKVGGNQIDPNCGNDATWDPNEQKCVCKVNTYKFNETTKTCAFDLATCREVRRGKPEGMACCEVNEARWENNKCTCNDRSKHFEIYNTNHGRCVANGGGGSFEDFSRCGPSGGSVMEGGIDPNTRRMTMQCFCSPEKGLRNKTKYECECVDSSKHYDSNRKMCVAANNGGGNGGLVVVPETFTCPEDNMNALRGKYTSCSKYVEALRALEEYCVSEGRKGDTFWEMYHAIEAIIPECEQAAASQTVTVLIGKINDKLNGWKDSLNVWKNKEGKFNTARLASDSIAGVVLGTAGGLITSSIVKKSQVKAGFEDINCTIGGQKVADWDDEFTVGIQ